MNWFDDIADGLALAVLLGLLYWFLVQIEPHLI